VIGPPVIICLEMSAHAGCHCKNDRAVRTEHAGDRSHLVQNMDFEYAYVCYCERTRQMWARWLERKYADVRKANAILGYHLRGVLERADAASRTGRKNRALWFDWASFT